MGIIKHLSSIWSGSETPFLIHNDTGLTFSQVLAEKNVDLSPIKKGDVIALIGDFNPQSISTLMNLIDLGTIIVPLSMETEQQHSYFFETALVDFIIRDGQVTQRQHNQSHKLIDELRKREHAGLILFSTGTTGRPKAILHDLSLFLKRFETPRPALRTLSFLLFDHIGGLNTLFHTLYNKGVVISAPSRTVESILESCQRYGVEALPTTPTFLRMMLMSGLITEKFPACVKVVTYGTERMDQITLDQLCELLPEVDFRQTFGMSELGIVRVKSEHRQSLFMKIGGEGVKTRVVGTVLQIHSDSRMLGYLNADSPFDSEGWYDTKDVVEVKREYYKVVGRVNEVINVGGLKFMASEVERTALMFPYISLVKVQAKSNPITGQHVELIVQPQDGHEIDKNQLMQHLKHCLQPHMVPKRIKIESINIGHRFKRA